MLLHVYTHGRAGGWGRGGFHPKDMDYRIYNIRGVILLCIYTAGLGGGVGGRGGVGVGGGGGGLIRRAFVQSAQILTVEKSRGRRKALHVTVTRPFGDHGQSSRTLSSSSGMQQLLAPAVFLTLETKE